MSLGIEVDDKHIKQHSDVQLTDLLRRLLVLEAHSSEIPFSSSSVPLEITVADGGEDGRIKWIDGPKRTMFLPGRFTTFQVKSGKLTRPQFAKHVKKP